MNFDLIFFVVNYCLHAYQHILIQNLHVLLSNTPPKLSYKNNNNLLIYLLLNFKQHYSPLLVLKLKII